MIDVFKILERVKNETGLHCRALVSIEDDCMLIRFVLFPYDLNYQISIHKRFLTESPDGYIDSIIDNAIKEINAKIEESKEDYKPFNTL